MDESCQCDSCLPTHYFAQYDHLGSLYPYFYDTEPGKLYPDIASAVNAAPSHLRAIDPVGVVELLSRGYMFGRRTLLVGLQKAPWLARPDACGRWEYAEVPRHGRQIIADQDLVREFRLGLEKEALDYLDGKKRVGILLSGGMDSRIIAGVVRGLQLTGQFAGEVVGLTWGVSYCRDVIYATEVAKRYGWELVHFKLNPEQLLENIRIAGEMGAEFAPFHLHALPSVARMSGLDAILGGNYGDSVGRGEYSGTHVESLGPTVASDLNKYGLVLEGVVKASRGHILDDAYGYRQTLNREHEYQYRELEYQMHCIRRRTQAVVNCVGQHIPFYQLFTSPAVFGLVWKLKPAIRDDRIYKGLLKTLPGNLGEIPWARTGRLFGSSKGKGDQLPKEHHRYGYWLRNDLRKDILSLVDSDTIRGLGVFNVAMLDKLLNLWPKANTLTTNMIDVNISWLASLAVFVRSYQVNPIPTTEIELLDRWKTVSGFFKAWTYQVVRGKFRS